MILHLHKGFQKEYKKLRKSEKVKFKERRNIFLNDEFDPVLNNHLLKGKYIGFRSINITGDIRVIYKRENDTIFFITVGTHSNLYG